MADEKKDEIEEKANKISISNWITVIGLIFIAGGLYFQVNVMQKDLDFIMTQWGPDLENMEKVLKYEDETLESRLHKKILIINDLQETVKELEIENIKNKTYVELLKKDLEIENLKLEHKIDIIEIKMNK